MSWGLIKLTQFSSYGHDFDQVLRYIEFAQAKVEEYPQSQRLEWGEALISDN